MGTMLFTCLPTLIYYYDNMAHLCVTNNKHVLIWSLQLHSCKNTTYSFLNIALSEDVTILTTITEDERKGKQTSVNKVNIHWFKYCPCIAAC